MNGIQPTYVAVPREVNNTADTIPSYSSCYAGRHAAQSLISKYTGFVASGTGIACDIVNRVDEPIEHCIGCNVSNLGPRKLAPINCGQLGENLSDQTTKLRLRAEVPHLTRKDVSLLREPIYETMCRCLLQNGYHKAFSEMFHLYEKQNEDRRIAGPDSPLWFIPPIAEQPEKIKLLAHHLSQAEKASRRRDHHTLFTSYLLLGRAFQDCPDDLWLAEHFLKYALKIAETITDDDKLKLATAHQYYGLILQSRGQLIPAAVSLQEFYNLTRGKQWTNDCGVLLSNLATKYLVENYLKRIDESAEEYHSDRIRLCREAQEISLKCDQWNVEAPVWRRLGLLLEDAGQFDEALKTYKSYFEKASAKEDYTNLGLACEALAKLCQRQKRLEESIQHLQKFACVCERHGRWTELGRACQMLGSAYDAIGDHASGLKWMKKAYSLPHMIQCLKPEDFRESVEAARIMIGISRAHLMNKAYSINMLDECPSAVSRVIEWKSEPFNEEEIFPIKELKLPPIKFKDRQPNRDVLKYALHPSTGFLHYK
ncbi:Tetratricopeptide repeat protein 29 [Fasciola hepatica]|uniref:Tetratricopeptide repeat protein 29 n=1 Tax=Fasciola hepatica TaxID=6192 RepID=A0A4E0R9K9_FASHE|nr:Tetratricopeptide repeat protein 29 [Fasciola hepatica]